MYLYVINSSSLLHFEPLGLVYYMSTYSYYLGTKNSMKLWQQDSYIPRIYQLLRAI